MQASEITRDQIKGYECKHVNYVRAQDDSRDDLLAIKEQIHLHDGTTVPNIRFVENFKRDFWITKSGHQNHNDKKEWESLNKLQKFQSTQNTLTQNIARALGNPAMKGSLAMMSRNQYLYGTDVTTPVIAKRKYMDSFPDCISLNQVSVLDIETDVNEGTEDPISVALTFKDKAILTVTKDFLGTLVEPQRKILEGFTSYLGQYQKERNINLEVVIADDPGHAIVEVIKRAHQWMPDFVSIWNINFDLPKIIECLKKYGYDPAEVFSDPQLPPKYQYAYYKEGPAGKMSASGVYTAFHPADRWHTMFCPASFYFIDAMCTYKAIRIVKGNEDSYALDYILGKDLDLGKLKFDEGQEYSGIEWHQYMQKYFKVEYLIYNLFDCIGVELLDEKNKDLASTISVLTGHSEYQRFKSQPRRTCDDLHFYCLQNGLAIASTSDDMQDELDQYVLSMDGWITTLPTHLVEDNGLKAIEELLDTRTGIRAHTLDLDVSSAYPSTEVILNISKETTYRELCKMRDIPEEKQRRSGINLTGGRTNATEIACDIFQAPTFDQLLEEFEKESA